MRFFLFLTSLTWLSVAALLPAASANPIAADCTYQGLKLYGKFQVVNSFPDIKVQVVQSFPDLKVKKVQTFPDECGKWQQTQNFPDLKIQFVKTFPDIKIQYVESFPGLP